MYYTHECLVLERAFYCTHWLNIEDLSQATVPWPLTIEIHLQKVDHLLYRVSGVNHIIHRV